MYYEESSYLVVVYHYVDVKYEILHISRLRCATTLSSEEYEVVKINRGRGLNKNIL